MNSKLVSRSPLRLGKDHTLTIRPAVYSRDRLSTVAYLSGPGRRELIRDVITPGSIPDGHPVPDDGLLTIWLMRLCFHEPDPLWEDEDTWGFPFHDPCWQMIALVRPGDDDEHADIQALFDVLGSFPVQDMLVNSGHDYGSDAHYQRFVGTVPVGRERKLVQGPVPEHQIFDPLELFGLRRFLEEEPDNGRSSFYTGARKYRVVTGFGPFSGLPTEVLQYTLQYLATEDVLRLSQSSRACANVPLDQSFWMSRFLPGREFEPIFEARQKQNAVQLRERWHSLYLLVKTLRKSKRFKNRERVFRLASSLRAIVEQVASTNLCGDADTLQLLHWIDAHTTLKSYDTSLSDGSRVFNYRGLAVLQGCRQLFVSLVDVYGWHYVAGIRFGASVLGYRHASSEISITVHGQFVGFYLAQDERGLRGLAVIPASGAMSEWAGGHNGVPIRRLVPGPTTTAHGTIRHMKCGFDVSSHSYPEKCTSRQFTLGAGAQDRIVLYFRRCLRRKCS